MSENDRKTEWRDIWQEIIKVSRDSLLHPNMSYPLFDDIEQKYPNDKMILFEKAITAECLGDMPTAKDFYLNASNETTGLPVKHWRERAEYFYNRINNDIQCHAFGELDTKQDLRSVQLDTYYNIHSFCHLDNYIRYLAISSVSRIASEPAMAIVIFRTCLEIGLWTYFKELAERINNDYKAQHKEKKYDIGLDDLLTEINNQIKLKADELFVYDKIRIHGNKAAHPGLLDETKRPYHYKNSELIEILDYFNKTMKYLDSRAEKNNSLVQQKN